MSFARALRVSVIAAFLAVAVTALHPVVPMAVGATPSPSPSPTNPPTPFLPLEQVPNGKWQIILQGPKEPDYSTMVLKDVGVNVTGTWMYKNASYVVIGTREGSRLKLDLKPSAAPNAESVGKVDATIDGIADMFGLITLNGVETPFQGAQHSRVPAPVESSPSPGPTRSPY